MSRICNLRRFESEMERVPLMLFEDWTNVIRLVAHPISGTLHVCLIEYKFYYDSAHYEKRKRRNLNLSPILAKFSSTGSVLKVIHAFQANRKSRKITVLYDIQELVDIDTATSPKQILCRGTIQLESNFNGRLPKSMYVLHKEEKFWGNTTEKANGKRVRREEADVAFVGF
ncbi:hypothetical protein VNO77_30661 [Canavalia gladiata]|uniref:Uncharacterized protein n=1 Tax=Canavalia gladiata TaxID=3824 RepID=A0AAN9Q3C7_CANGL